MNNNLSGRNRATVGCIVLCLTGSPFAARAQHQELNVPRFQELLQKDLFFARHDALNSDPKPAIDEFKAVNEKAINLAANYSEWVIGDALDATGQHIRDSDFYLPGLISAYSCFEVAHLSKDINDQNTYFVRTAHLPLANDPRETAEDTSKKESRAHIKEFHSIYSSDLIQMMAYVSWLRSYQIDVQKGVTRKADLPTAYLFLNHTLLLRKKIERFDAKKQRVYLGLPAGSSKIFGTQEDFNHFQDAILSEHDALLQFSVKVAPASDLTGPQQTRRVSGSILSLFPVEIQAFESSRLIARTPGKTSDFSLDIPLGAGEGEHHIEFAVQIPRPDGVNAALPIGANQKADSLPVETEKNRDFLRAWRMPVKQADAIVFTVQIPHEPTPAVVTAYALNAQVRVHASPPNKLLAEEQRMGISLTPDFNALKNAQTGESPQIAWKVFDAANNEVPGTRVAKHPIASGNDLQYDYSVLLDSKYIGKYQVQAEVYWPGMPDPALPQTLRMALTIAPKHYEGMAFIVNIGKYDFGSDRDAPNVLNVLNDKKLIVDSLKTGYRYEDDQIFWISAGEKIEVSPSLGLRPEEDPTTRGGTMLSKHFLLLALQKFAQVVRDSDTAHVFLSYSGHGFYIRPDGVPVDMFRLPIREDAIKTHDMAKLLLEGETIAFTNPQDTLVFTPNQTIEVAGFYDACIKNEGVAEAPDARSQNTSSGTKLGKYSYLQSCQQDQVSRLSPEGGYFALALTRAMAKLVNSDHWMRLLAREATQELASLHEEAFKNKWPSPGDQKLPQVGGNPQRPYVRQSISSP